MTDLRSTLFVGNLSVFCSEGDIESLFSTYGVILEIRMAKSEDKSKHLSYGFVKFASVASAQLAMHELNGALLCGRPLKIGKAFSRSNKKSLIMPHNEPEYSTASVHVTFISHQLSHIVNEESLRMLFSQFGHVVDAVICKSTIDQQQGRQSGYGFIHFIGTTQGIEASFRAAEMLTDVMIDNVNYKCKISHHLEKQLRDYNSPSSTPTGTTSYANSIDNSNLFSELSLNNAGSSFGNVGMDNLTGDVESLLSDEQKNVMGLMNKPDSFATFDSLSIGGNNSLMQHKLNSLPVSSLMPNKSGASIDLGDDLSAFSAGNYAHHGGRATHANDSYFNQNQHGMHQMYHDHSMTKVPQNYYGGNNISNNNNKYISTGSPKYANAMMHQQYANPQHLQNQSFNRMNYQSHQQQQQQRLMAMQQQQQQREWERQQLERERFFAFNSGNAGGNHGMADLLGGLNLGNRTQLDSHQSSGVSSLFGNLLNTTNNGLETNSQFGLLDNSGIGFSGLHVNDDQVNTLMTN